MSVCSHRDIKRRHEDIDIEEHTYKIGVQDASIFFDISLITFEHIIKLNKHTLQHLQPPTCLSSLPPSSTPSVLSARA
jgi:hypothetical protein